MQPLLIKLARLEDMTAFLELGRTIGEVPGVWGKNPQEDFIDHLQAMKKGKEIFLLVISKKYMIIGFVVVHLFKRLDPTGFDRQSCTVGVAVHPEYRRRGIGTQLIQRALKEAKEHGIEEVYTSTGIENIGMQRLAEKLGFIRYAIIEKNGWKFTRYKREILV